MTDAPDIEPLLQRARREATQARPYFAYRLYMEAWSRLSEAEQRVHGPRILDAALDVCLDYLEKDAPELLLVTSTLLSLTGGNDARALAARGVARSLTARNLRRSGQHEAAADEALRAEQDLEAATERVPFDAGAWGALGGVRKRMSGWARADGDPERAREIDRRMLDAYERGAKDNRDAYTLLNFLEYRAVVDARGLAGKVVNGRRPPLLRLVRGADERRALARALEVRRHQFQRGEDAPWAAFDLARGQHYLAPDVLRLLSDLGVAIEDARRAARRESDRWMVESALSSLRDLHEVGYPLDGLDDAILLLGRAASAEGWAAGSWAPLARGEDYLGAELREARAEIARLAESSAAQRGDLERLLLGTEQRWSRDDEERFQKELDRFAGEVEAPAKKYLRVVWRLLDEEALAEAVAELPAMLGMGPLPALGGLVVRAVIRFLKRRGDE